MKRVWTVADWSMLLKHMQFRIFCALAMAFVLAFAAEAAVEAPNLSRPQDLYDGTPSPALGDYQMSMAATPVGDGFVVAWSSNDGGPSSDGVLHVEHLDSAGDVTESTTVSSTCLTPLQHKPFCCAPPDGVETIVAEDALLDFHVTVHIAADGPPRLVSSPLKRNSPRIGVETAWLPRASSARRRGTVGELDRIGNGHRGSVDSPAY